ncbi:hypothetical protein [Blastopirellula marina]|uniref:Leucine-rich repeat domain-containing protein n=1 Tax=Blastopirellula marina TaxID=124 RepID=A0A2S8FSK9_9BACT|nr:hypothetical protein [Blastopirellula marina]PQO35172.1 hypothetical protein C5Y98_14575 [Blastopirellula marina]PTL43921.1 hypothetical protein C5Y97_14585 [Blastopirellula marina]
MNRIRQWTWLILAPLWRWKWLFLVCLFITVTYGAATFRSEPNTSFTVYTPAFGPTISYTTVHYGWPLEYAQREFDDSKPIRVWAFWERGQYSDLRRLAANLGLALLLAGLITHGVAWRFARKPRWQFQLKEVIVLVVVLSAILAYAVRLESVYRQDQQYLADLTKEGFAAGRTEIPALRRPLRDVGLISNDAAYQYWLQWNNHSQGELLDQMLQYQPKSGDVNQLLRQQASGSRRLSNHFVAVTIDDDQLDDAGLAALLAWTPSGRFLNLRGEQLSPHGLAQIAEQRPNLQILALYVPELDGDALEALAPLDNLESLLISDCDLAAGPAILRLAEQLPSLRYLSVPELVVASFSEEEIAALTRRGVSLTAY